MRSLSHIVGISSQADSFLGSNGHNGHLLGLLREKLDSLLPLHAIKQFSRTVRIGKSLICNDIPTGTLL